jgi:hypothetical protein
VLSSCSSSPTGTDAAVKVRVRNATTLAITDVSVTWPGGSLAVPSVAPGGVSAYMDGDGAYRYGAVRLMSGGKERRLQPIDYFGETPLAPGRYTYVIIASQYFSDGIDLALEQDP